MPPAPLGARPIASDGAACRRPGQARRGAILLIVVGLTVVLLGLAVTYTVSIRADAATVRTLMLQTQSRVALSAACLYILEAGRIGWGEEAFGWLDIRDASRLDRSLAPLNASGGIVTHAGNPLPGPRGLDGRQLPKRADGSWDVSPAAAPLQRWPALGGVARVTLLPADTPPYATQGRFAYNPVPLDRAVPTKTDNVRYNNLDPQPVGFPDPEPTGAWSHPAGAYTAWAKGDRANAGEPASLAIRSRGATAWFRVFRSHFDTFIVSVGSGGSDGFRSWDEVQSAGATAQFFDNQALFEDILADDRRMWYEVRWSPSVAGRYTYIYAGQEEAYSTSNNSGFQNSLARPGNNGMELIPLGMSMHMFQSHYAEPFRPHPINQMGTISHMRRLSREPANW